MRVVSAAVADDRDLVPQHPVEVFDHCLACRFVARHAVPFGKALEDGRHLVRLRIRLAHPPRHHTRAGLREEVAPFRAAALDDVTREVEVVGAPGQLVQAHERLQQRRRLNAVRAPPDLADVALRRGTDLADEAVGLTLERGQHLRTALHPFIVVLQRQHHVFPLPEVAAVRTRVAVTTGLQVLRHATDAAVRTLRREDVRHRAVQHRLQFGIAPVAVLHRARPHELPPHLAERELRPSLPEELRELAVRHVPLVPMRDALFNRHLQSARQRHGAGRKRFHHIPCLRLRNGRDTRFLPLGRVHDAHDDGALEVREFTILPRIHPAIFPWEIARETFCEGNLLACDRRGRLAAHQLALPRVRLVAAPQQRRVHAAKTPDAEATRLRVERTEMFQRRINALHRHGKAREVPPEVIAVDILVVPVPGLSAPGGTGKERREYLVVEEHAELVLRVKFAGAGVIGLHGADLGQHRRGVGTPVEEFLHGVRRQHVHGATADVQLGAGVEVAVDLHEVVEGDPPEVVVVVVGGGTGEAAEVLDGHLARKHHAKLLEHAVAPGPDIAAPGADAVDLVPELPARDSRGIAESEFFETLRLAEIDARTFPGMEEFTHVLRVRRIEGTVEERRVHPLSFLAGRMDGTETLERQLELDAELLAQGDRLLQRGLRGGIVFARPFGHDLEEGMPQPKAHEVAAVRGEGAQPAEEFLLACGAGTGRGGVVHAGKADVTPHGDERLAIRIHEIPRIDGTHVQRTRSRGYHTTSIRYQKDHERFNMSFQNRLHALFSLANEPDHFTY